MISSPPGSAVGCSCSLSALPVRCPFQSILGCISLISLSPCLARCVVSPAPPPLRWAAVATRGPGGKRQTSPLRGLCRGRRARSPSYVTASLFCKKRRTRAWPSPCSRVRAAGRSIVLARDVGVGVADQRPPGAFPSRLHSPPQGLRY